MTNWYEFSLSFEAEDEEAAADIGDKLIIAYCGRAWWKWRPWRRDHQCRRSSWVGVGPLLIEDTDEDS